MKLGAIAPDFNLPDGNGRVLSRDEVRGPKGLVVAFLCNHCPYVIHLAKELGIYAANCEAKGIGFVGINSNDILRYPADSPEKMIDMARDNDWTFPYLLDESQSVAHAYHAACTPDFYVFDDDLRLVYCGQFDDSRPRNGKPVTGSGLRIAVQAVIDHKLLEFPQRPSTGCNIKWKPGNEPDWFRV